VELRLQPFAWGWVHPFVHACVVAFQIQIGYRQVEVAEFQKQLLAVQVALAVMLGQIGAVV